MKGFNNTEIHISESQTPWAERLRAHWLNMSVLFRALYLPFTAWSSPPQGSFPSEQEQRECVYVCMNTRICISVNVVLARKLI